MTDPPIQIAHREKREEEAGNARGQLVEPETTTRSMLRATNVMLLLATQTRGGGT
jgi:hypothetical protein